MSIESKENNNEKNRLDFFVAQQDVLHRWTEKVVGLSFVKACKAYAFVSVLKQTHKNMNVKLALLEYTTYPDMFSLFVEQNTHISALDQVNSGGGGKM